MYGIPIKIFSPCAGGAVYGSSTGENGILKWKSPMMKEGSLTKRVTRSGKRKIRKKLGPFL
jgi:hypothetical protein